MTLIATVFDIKSIDFAAVSDILVSDSSLAPGDRNILPLQAGLAVPFSATQGRRVVSKAVIFGNYLLMWAGNLAIARELISVCRNSVLKCAKDFHRAVGETRAICAQKFFDLRFDVEATLYCYDGEFAWDAAYPINSYPIDNYFLHVSGTGTEEFLKNAKRSIAKKAGARPIDIAVEGICNSMVRELTETAHSYDAFGGGYEVFYFKEGGGFERVPYSILEISRIDHLRKKFLGFRYTSRLIQCCPYSGGTLYITIIFPNIDSNQSPQAHFFFVNELDSAKTRLDWDEIAWNPTFGVAMVIDSGTMTSIRPNPVGWVNANDGKLTVEMDSSTIEECNSIYRAKFEGEMKVSPEQKFDLIRCQGCGANFSEVDISAVNVETGRIETAEYLCDSCKT